MTVPLLVLAEQVALGEHLLQLTITNGKNYFEKNLKALESDQKQTYTGGQSALTRKGWYRNFLRARILTYCILGAQLGN